MYFSNWIFESSTKSYIPDRLISSFSPFTNCFALRNYFFDCKNTNEKFSSILKWHSPKLIWVLTIINSNSCCLLLCVAFVKKPSSYFWLIMVYLGSFIQIRKYIYFVIEIKYLWLLHVSFPWRICNCFIF